MVQDILEMMEHIDDDEYFHRKLATKAVPKRKEVELARSPKTTDDIQTKKQRSVDDYCDDSELTRSA
jgi:hypothetical protein